MNTYQIILLLYIAAILLAMLMGGTLASGIFCMIQRRRAGEKWAGKTRSHCDACGRTLTARDLIPVISYLALHGKCRTCGAKIPSNGFIIELMWSEFAGLAMLGFLILQPKYAALVAAEAVIASAITMKLAVKTEKEKS